MSATLLQPVGERSEALRAEGLGYVYEPPGLPLRLRVDYLHRRSDEFTAELLVERTDRSSSLLHMARINLVSTVGRRNVTNHLKELVKDDHDLDVNWVGLLEQLCIGVISREREGAPFYRASEMRAVTRPPDLITRLLPGTGPCMWFAPQGSGKGWAGEIACAAISAGKPFAGLATRRVLPLYLDWEDSPEVWHERLIAVSLGLELDDLPDVRYRQCRQRLAADLPSILRYVATEGIGLVVVDSVGPAMGAGESGQRMDEQAIGLFESLRHLSPLPVLLIDHMTGEAASSGPQKEDKAFGSIYKMAEVRTAWALRKEQDTDADEQSLAFYHRKHNHTKKFPAVGARLCFESDTQGWASRVWLERADVRDSEHLSKGLSQPEQVLAFLRRNGPATVEVIADATGLKDNQTRSILSRLGKRNTVVRFDDGRWALGVAPSVADLRPV